MSKHNRKLARRLARMTFNLDWAKGAGSAAHGWVLAGKEGSAEFEFCFHEALNGARAAVREGEAIERALHPERKAGA